MNEQELRCCNRSPILLIEFNTSSRKFEVCNECLQLPFYSRGIIKKIPIPNIIGQGRPQQHLEGRYNV